MSATEIADILSRRENLAAELDARTLGADRDPTNAFNVDGIKTNFGMMVLQSQIDILDERLVSLGAAAPKRRAN